MENIILGTHIMEAQIPILLKTILIGKIEEERGPDGKQHSWLYSIRKWCDIPDVASLLDIQKRIRFLLCDKSICTFIPSV